MRFNTVRELAKEVFVGLAKHGRSPVLSSDEIEARVASGQAVSTIKLIPSSAIIDCDVDLSAAEAVKVGDVQKVRRYFVEAGDVLVICRGTVVRSAVVRETVTNVAISASLIGIRVDAAKVLPSFLCAYLAHPNGIEAILRRTSSTTSALNISPKSIAEVEVPLPPLEIQRQLADLFESAIRYRKTARRIADMLMSTAHDEIIRHLERVA